MEKRGWAREGKDHIQMRKLVKMFHLLSWIAESGKTPPGIS